jgi:hypothetical protein
MQQKVIGAIDSVVFGGRRPGPAPVATGQQRAASAAGARN